MPQWTAKIIITESINKYLYFGKLRYLFEQAPRYLLKSGEKFIVYDGPAQVAQGKVLTNFGNNIK